MANSSLVGVVIRIDNRDFLLETKVQLAGGRLTRVNFGSRAYTASFRRSLKDNPRRTFGGYPSLVVYPLQKQQLFWRDADAFESADAQESTFTWTDAQREAQIDLETFTNKLVDLVSSEHCVATRNVSTRAADRLDGVADIFDENGLLDTHRFKATCLRQRNSFACHFAFIPSLSKHGTQTPGTCARNAWYVRSQYM